MASKMHFVIIYREPHKLSKKKFCTTLHFIGFHQTFAIFALSVWKVLKKAIAQLNIRQENLVHQKSMKTAKLFSRLSFIIYGILMAGSSLP